MEKVLYRLNFNEGNLDSQKKRLSELLRESRSSRTAVSFNRLFPPCILKQKHKIHENGPLILGFRNVILSNNLYFGEKYRNINRLFHFSPFISEKCRDCEYNRNFLCRGLPNNRFLRQEKEIKERIGRAEYEAARAEYENGIIAFGSVCLQKCKLCYNDFFSPGVLAKIPFLTADEMAHFVHYLPRRAGGIGDNLHCQRGNLMDSPHFQRAMKILRFFIEPGATVDTRGYEISEENAKILKEAGAKATIDTVYTLDQKNIDKYVHGGKKINYIKIINILRKSGVGYAVNLFPLESLVESGDFFRTIGRLISNDRDCRIIINDSSLMAPIDSKSPVLNRKIVGEIIRDFAGLKKEIKKRYPGRKNFSFPVSRRNLAMPREAEKNAAEIAKGKGWCLMVSEIDGKKYGQAIKVPSSLGFVPSFARMLLVKDLAAAKNAPGKCRRLAVPRAAFDAEFNDPAMASLNDLWKKIKDRFNELVLY